jgi:hypothetical protein
MDIRELRKRVRDSLPLPRIGSSYSKELCSSILCLFIRWSGVTFPRFYFVICFHVPNSASVMANRIFCIKNVFNG